MNPNAGVLSQIAVEFDRDGVVTIPGLFSEADVATIRAELARIVQEDLHAMPPADYVLEADGESVRNLWRLESHSEFFRGLSHSASLLDLVRPLVHGEPVVMAVESFNKPARVGSPVPPHQDNAYFCLAPPDALTMWIAIDPVTEDNGPIQYVRGSHLQGTRPHVSSGVSGNSMGLRDEPDSHDPYAVLLAPGDALIHHCETIHYSAANTSDRPRCALLIVYRGAHCEKNAALHETYTMAR